VVNSGSDPVAETATLQHLLTFVSNSWYTNQYQAETINICFKSRDSTRGNFQIVGWFKVKSSPFDCFVWGRQYLFRSFPSCSLYTV